MELEDLAFSRILDLSVDDVPETVTPTGIIASTFKIYGSTFLILFVVFLFLRSKFPLTYTHNSRVLKHITPLSQHRFGPIEWIYKVFQFTDEEIFQHCGMSAIVYLRFLRLGFKLSCVGIFNSFILIPSNLHGCNPPEVSAVDSDTNTTIAANATCADLTDRVLQISLSNVSGGSPNVFATTVAAYIIFGSAMYFIFHEFEWYTQNRHKFCTQPRPENYTAYVEHIPLEYRSDARLLEYFQTIFSKERVLDAKVAVGIENLEKKVAKREQVVEKLEHAVNIRNVKGYEPTHGNPLAIGKGGIGETVPSIPEYSKQLNKLNEDITGAIERIEAKKGEEKAAFELALEGLEEDEITGGLPTKAKALLSEEETLKGRSGEGTADLDAEDKKHRRNKSSLSSFGNAALGKMKDAAGTVGGTVLNSANIARSLIAGSEDGKVLDAGFVTFSSFLAKNQCVQIIHHATPFNFNTKDAPRPDDVYWPNVGKPHKEQQVSYLLAQVATIATCLFWTIPVSFFASLSEVDSLKELIPGLETATVNYPWLTPFLLQLSPLMLVILTSLLPAILSVFCKKEGHIGSDTLNASLLTKLAMFMIVQIFFVQAISGSILAVLEEVIDQPLKIISYLAVSVPSQVKAFIQFVQVQNFLGCALELLRLPRVVMALLRERIGPNLTEKERNTPYMGILPMSEPEEMEYPMLFAEMILYFMINLVYSCIAPVMSYILLICFGLLNLVFRHQLIYTYSRENDDGGKLWSSAIMLLITCMIISEFTLIGIVFLKKAFIPGVLLIPLIAGTFLFTSYIKQQHFLVTQCVPSTLCSAVDKASKDLDLSFLKEKYLQPALHVAVKEEYPDNVSSEETLAHGKPKDSKKNSLGAEVKEIPVEWDSRDSSERGHT